MFVVCFYDEFEEDDEEVCEEGWMFFGWVVVLYEIGLLILYSVYYKYLVYIVSNVDMLGFLCID